MKNNQQLIEHIREKALFYLDNRERSKRVLEAMLKVDRKDFLPLSIKEQAYQDIPLPIGYGQTCSQPSMVAFMMDRLEVKPGHTILEIGSGCGYAASIASVLCSSQGGFVYASEIIAELAAFMTGNTSHFSDHLKVLSGDGSTGFPEYAPYDRIFLSAGVGKNFNRDILIELLKIGGVLVYPERYGNLYKIRKKKKKIIEEIYYGVSFVPLKGRNS